jgi:hypothetical protein
MPGVGSDAIGGARCDPDEVETMRPSVTGRSPFAHRATNEPVIAETARIEFAVVGNSCDPLLAINGLRRV